MNRSAVSWIAVGLLALSCFAPWATVTVDVNVSEQHGAFEEAFYGGPYLLGVAIVAALGLLVRRQALTRTCAVLAGILTVVMCVDLPETMLQFGHQAGLAWGPFLAVASSIVLAIAARPMSFVSRAALAEQMRAEPSGRRPSRALKFEPLEHDDRHGHRDGGEKPSFWK